MSRIARRFAILALCAAGFAPVSAAQAQWSMAGARQSPPPLYPYELQPGQSYAVEVAPGTYVIHHPAGQRAYRDVHRRAKHVARRHRAAPKAKIRPKRTHADRALIEELRQQAATRATKKAAKRAGRKPDQVINTRKIVHEKPLVIETRRVVNDPPKVIERRRYVDDVPAPRPPRHTGSVARKPADNDDPRVIHADAEITILGPDRMSIRLVRKDGGRLDVNARAGKAK